MIYSQEKALTFDFHNIVSLRAHHQKPSKSTILKLFSLAVNNEQYSLCISLLSKTRSSVFSSFQKLRL